MSTREYFRNNESISERISNAWSGFRLPNKNAEEVRMKKWFGILTLLMVLMLQMILPVGAVSQPGYKPEDLAIMKVALPDGEKYGYLLVSNGKWVILPQFEGAHRTFYQDTGLAAVKSGGKYGFIDIKGQMVIPTIYDHVGFSWNEGLINVEVGKLTGFIDITGKMMIGLQPGRVNSFSEGLSSVYLGDKTKYIDKTGTVAFEVDGLGQDFNEGLAPIIKTQGRGSVGFINKSGQTVIDPQTSLLIDGMQWSSFHDERAVTKIDNKFGFIDKQGTVVIPAVFDGATVFREGLAPVLIGQKIGYIDTDGHMVLPAQYDPVGNWLPRFVLDFSLFTDGIARVKWNGKFGVIDKKGDWVAQPIFDRPVDYFYSKQKVVYTGGYYYDQAGKKLDHYVNHMRDGDIALKNGDMQKAAEYYIAALKINPGDVSATWKLSQVK